MPARANEHSQDAARGRWLAKHEKTFTGCWTCRVRKIKCDERRPACGQCIQKQLECEGYDVRLHWLAAETATNTPGSNAAESIRPRHYRSNVVFGPARPVLSALKLDQTIACIDTYVSRHELNSRKSQVDANITQFIDGFGVFSAGHAREDEPETPVFAADDHTRDITAVPRAEPIIALDPAMTEAAQNLLHCARNNTAVIDDPLATPYLVHLLRQESPETGQSDTNLPLTSPRFQLLDSDTASWDSCDESRTQTTTSHETQVLDEQQSQHHQGQTDSCSADLWPLSLPYVLPSVEERFLLNHYATKVVHLFSVCDNPKSPWKTIHLPRMLQSTGEITITGSTSLIRNALRYCLLSVSAYCLSSESKTFFRLDDSRRWEREASKYRGKAIMHLREAMVPRPGPHPPLKYKECLATILSMISINVYSGDTESCGLHLDGAERFIRHARTWKKRYSHKARALHRIYFYLRTIHRSTLTSRPYVDLASPHDELVESLYSPSLERARTESDIAPTSQLDEQEKALSTYEYIYGIPHDLLLFLNRATTIINELNIEREAFGKREVSAHLAAECEVLETEIMEWSYPAAQGPLAGMSSTNAEIILQMTVAFHNALIIYFAQHIRPVGHRYLQSFAERVIDAVEAVERIKAEKDVLGAPLYWPAFIAASEAFDSKLQSRFRNWYQQAQSYGIEAARTGLVVLTELWKQGPPAKPGICGWRSVIERCHASLILT